MLDEQVDWRLKRRFGEGFDVSTVVERGWGGTKNGPLLRLAEREFDVFVTTDQGIPHQQDVSRLNLTLILLEAKSNRYADLGPLIDRVAAVLLEARPGEVIRLSRKE